MGCGPSGPQDNRVQPGKAEIKTSTWSPPVPNENGGHGKSDDDLASNCTQPPAPMKGTQKGGSKRDVTEGDGIMGSLKNAVRMGARTGGIKLGAVKGPTEQEEEKE